MMRTPDGHGRLELTKYHSPAAIGARPPNPPANTLGLHRVMFAVDDIDDASPACGLTAPNSSVKWRSTRTATGSATCAAPRGSSSPWPNRSANGPWRATCDQPNDPLDGPRTTIGGINVQPNEIAEVLNRPISQELLARDVTHLAYVAKDGTPRTVPIIFTWNGSEIVMCTPKNAPKLQALSENPMVALTIDTEVHPPKILLLRGRAELDFVDGIPEEFLQATSTYQMTPEQRVEWEAEVRSLYYDGMVRIVVTPNWAKLIDFETTLPSAVEELIRQREERQRSSVPE
jgi:Pyridoxamine 5'-phosphate oxidase